MATAEELAAAAEADRVKAEEEARAAEQQQEVTQAGGAKPSLVPAIKPAAEDGTEKEEKVEPEKKPVETKPVDWRDQRIAQLTAKLKEERAKPKATPEASAAGTEGASPDAAEIERQVEARASAKAAMDRFNSDCAAAATAGREAFGEAEFNGRVAELTRLVDKADPASVGAYNEFLIAALETGEAPKIIHALGGDLNEAARVLSLPPIKRAVELTRLAAKEPAQSSQVPDPIKPIGGRAAPHTSIRPSDPERADKLDMATWMDRRNAEVAARNAARGR